MDTIVTHKLKPIYNKNSKILILGTMPSPKSRELNFYYSHPQNRFWRVISDIFDITLPTTNEEKTKFLYDNNIALWDVLHSCSISGADDHSIKNPIANDFTEVLNTCNITSIFTTGKKATSLYNKYCLSKTNREAIYLPSTSPANCRLSYESLIRAYLIILEHL